MTVLPIIIWPAYMCRNRLQDDSKDHLLFLEVPLAILNDSW